MEKVFFKLAKKAPKQLKIVHKKIEEVLENPTHYKNLRSPMQHLKSVHIDKSFVLVFSVDEEQRLVVVEDYDHHDYIYR